MAVLVTGGGMIGSQVAQRLVERGERPVLFDIAPRLNAIGSVVDPVKVTIVQGDILRPLDLIKAIREYEVDRIIHTAAFLSAVVQYRPYLGIETNIMGTANVLEAARILGLKRVVVASSAGAVLGAERVGERLGEDVEFRLLSSRPKGTWAVYGTTKIACELLGLNYHDMYGVDFVALRFARVFGPWKGAPSGLSVIVINQVIEGALTGRTVTVNRGLLVGKQDWLYAKDAANAAVLACYAEHPQQRVYNINMGEVYGFSDVLEILKKYLPGVQIELKELEGAVGAYPQVFSDISKAREELGYEPKYQLEAALKEYVEWMKANSD